MLGRQANFVDRTGTRRQIPEYAHMTSDYVRAFSAAALTIRRCVEPRLDGKPAVIVWEVEA